LERTPEIEAISVYRYNIVSENKFPHKFTTRWCGRWCRKWRTLP